MSFFRKPPRPGGLIAPPVRQEHDPVIEAGRRKARERAEQQARWAREAAERDAEFAPILDEKGRRIGVRRGGSGMTRYPVITTADGKRGLLIADATKPVTRVSLGRLAPNSPRALYEILPEMPQDLATMTARQAGARRQIAATREKTFTSIYAQWAASNPSPDPEGDQ